MTIPDWLAPHIASTCECGGRIYNNEALTRRQCLNPECPYHMAERIAETAKYFNIKGMGPATALSYIQMYQLKNHLEIIPILFKESKPRVHLHEVAHLAMIDGHDKDMRQFCEGFTSFESVFASKQNMPFWFIAQKDKLINAEQYFEIKAPLSKKILRIMMTGEVHGYPSRAYFVSLLNERYGQYVQVVDMGFRKTGIDCLVKEKDAAYHRKTQVAEERGIRIVTPKGLELGIIQYIKECEKDETGS